MQRVRRHDRLAELEHDLGRRQDLNATHRVDVARDKVVTALLATLELVEVLLALGVPVNLLHLLRERRDARRLQERRRVHSLGADDRAHVLLVGLRVAGKVRLRTREVQTRGRVAERRQRLGPGVHVLGLARADARHEHLRVALKPRDVPEVGHVVVDSPLRIQQVVGRKAPPRTADGVVATHAHDRDAPERVHSAERRRHLRRELLHPRDGFSREARRRVSHASEVWVLLDRHQHAPRADLVLALRHRVCELNRLVVRRHRDHAQARAVRQAPDR